MGTIKNDVVARHLNKHDRERDLLTPFLTCFDVTWGTRYQRQKIDFSAYFLAPEQTVKDQFGIDAEILLIMSDFSELQNRTMQAIDEFMKSLPARGRIDPTTVFLVSPDPKLREWVASYAALNPQFRVTIALSHDEIKAGRGNPYFLRAAMSEQLYARDLFNDQLPLKSDTFFFGRDKIAAEFVTAVKTSNNRGLFGLRKTGKTSLLFKVRRMAQQDGAKVLYYDCKDPAIRTLGWTDFLEQIISDIHKVYGRRPKQREGHVSRYFKEIVGDLCQDSNLCIIFDEIEWVSPVAIIDTHWHKDFVPFWQTMWTTQSEHRQLSFIVAGVNPEVTERAEVDGVQNPLFGIIAPVYLTGWDESDVRSMLHKFGKRMGLKFDSDAVVYMYKRYGGHPLLTRMAGSYVNAAISAKNAARPARIPTKDLQEGEGEREAEIMYYCHHIVSELSKFYPDEYEMLKWLATGNEADFHDFAANGNQIRHLRDYGLIKPSANGRTEIEIPVLARYIMDEQRRSDKAEDIYVVPADNRLLWLRNRLDRIGTDIRRLDKLGQSKGKRPLYGANGFPEAERLFAVACVTDQSTLENFLNTFNRCLVEPVESMGKALSIKDYFWVEVKASYPMLWESLLRIKVYRNEAMHIDLTPRVTAQLADMKTRDFMGRDLTSIQDHHFLMQQKVLDGLFLATMVETDRLL
ncbi:AAA family ATPase [Novosphingobium sp. TCA1]|uniref:AAA family ATPase n=1 Tax=Novosphingobium sp. TCA1 TaxID=2682474 RepID=UPI00130AE28C|nr:ATP-binding protein [Novosphingobium sp. TCA1]GFE73509.1 hypothetical protein NTCA1_11580 [Novosphingobium sp. TCA1]